MRGTIDTAVYTHRGLSAATNVVPWTHGQGRVLISDPVHDWWPQIVSDLQELVRLQDGWDGYHGLAVQLGSANFALNLLNEACVPQTPKPQIVPGVHGDLQIEWHTDKADIELHVISPNSVHAWRATASTGVDGEEHYLTTDFTILVGWIREIVELNFAASAAAA